MSLKETTDTIAEVGSDTVEMSLGFFLIPILMLIDPDYMNRRIEKRAAAQKGAEGGGGHGH